jgi:PIN domain nuclease of toxin-antitoxin system
MRFVLDTHIFWWLQDSPSLLTSAVRAVLEIPNAVLYVSYASIWELQIKLSLGKLESKLTLSQRISVAETKNRITLLPISLGHIHRLETLPHHHRDPFDRMLIAQALDEGIPIISKDDIFREYPIQIVW